MKENAWCGVSKPQTHSDLNNEKLHRRPLLRAPKPVSSTINIPGISSSTPKFSHSTTSPWHSFSSPPLSSPLADSSTPAKLIKQQSDII
ncbi:hypothetical protein AKJ16_DCAP06948 [Drosera capensis]